MRGIQKEPLRGASRVLALAAPEISLAVHARVHETLASLLPVVAVLDRGVFAADLRGTRRLLGEPERVARRALERVSHDTGTSLAAGLASGPFVARVLSERTPHGAVQVLRPEEERSFLAALDLEVLPLEPLVRDELALLGIERVGDFAALPRASVLDRFGWAAAHAHALACGEDPETLASSTPPKRLVSARHWDGAVDALEPLLFALRAIVDDLAKRLGDAGLAALRLGARLEREDAHPLRFERLVLPPTAAPRALLRSLRWMLEERRDLGRVTGVALEALTVEPLRGRQLGLFAPDGARREDALGVAAYLRSRLGPARVVRARVADPDARLPERTTLFEEVVS